MTFHMTTPRLRITSTSDDLSRVGSVIEGQCPHCASMLERREDCGWCPTCNLGHSIQGNVYSLHVEPTQFTLTTAKSETETDTP